jgi:hypothetical protein
VPVRLILRAALAAWLTIGIACEESSGGAGPAAPAFGTVQDRAALYDGLALEFSGSWFGWAIEPVPGPRLDALAFRVANGVAQPRSFDPRDVRIETADGIHWSRMVVGAEAELHPMTLAPFADASGWIFFQVRADARPVAVVWTAAPGLILRIPLPSPGKDIG